MYAKVSGHAPRMEYINSIDDKRFSFYPMCY